MELIEMKTLEQQSSELLNNLVLIQQELENKVTARNQFKKDTTAIVTSLTKMVQEIEQAKQFISHINEPNMFELFTNIKTTVQQLQQIAPDVNANVAIHVSAVQQTATIFEQSVIEAIKGISAEREILKNVVQTTEQHIQTIIPTVEKSMNSYEQQLRQMHNVFKQDVQITIATFEKEREAFNAILKNFKDQEQRIESYFDNTTAKLTTNNEHLAEQHTLIQSLKQQVTESIHQVQLEMKTVSHVMTQQQSKISSMSIIIETLTTSIVNHLEQLQTHFSTQLNQFNTKLDSQQAETNEKLTMLMKRLNEQDERQEQMLQQLSFISNWLSTNGEILIANSRSGLFGRKQ